MKICYTVLVYSCEQSSKAQQVSNYAVSFFFMLQKYLMGAASEKRGSTGHPVIQGLECMARKPEFETVGLVTFSCHSV